MAEGQQGRFLLLPLVLVQVPQHLSAHLYQPGHDNNLQAQQLLRNLRPLSSNSVRSPSAGSVTIPASPYSRHTPSVASASGSVSAGYPFPSPGRPYADSTSPVQAHRYPPATAYPPRESYSQAAPHMPSPGTPVPPGPPSAGYFQGQQHSIPPPLPQTPPVGTPGGAHPYLAQHQRSQSVHSNSTPTSAKSQHPYPPQQFASPVTINHPLPIKRAPSMYDSSQHQAADPQRRSLSHSERERSLSVSPKTRVPSLPSSAGHHSQASISGPSGHVAAPPPSATRLERASTPAKRKMDDRDVRPEDLDRQEPRPPPFEANGATIQQHRSARTSAGRSSTSPMLARRKPRHAARPIWAQTFDRQQLSNPNFIVRKPVLNHSNVNGKTEVSRQDRASSRHMSPEAARSTAQAPPQSQAQVHSQAQAQAQNQPTQNQALPAPVTTLKPTLLGPWEATISNQTPFDEMCRTVADFLFVLVVNNTDLGDIHRRGCVYEIEAKLGHITDRNNPSQRIEFPVQSEVVLSNNANINFVSSMTELQHKGYNEFLNLLVAEASPQNPKNKNSSDPRVPINYVHLRETDRSHRVPNHLRQVLHPALHQLMGNKPANVRVTTDQKSGEVKAKITKAKVSDLHIYFPQCDLDCRISINIEAEWHGSVDDLEQMNPSGDKADRHKDRLSYTQGNYRVDLTQVSQPEPGPSNTTRMNKRHELEIELDADAVIEQGRKAMRGEAHNYDFLIEGFVNNIRLMARKARDLVSPA
ncbi:mRNA-capping enzyme subunit beta [Cytospora mali]|uniref:mRNA-capping enzyme subunit beta n=1 Tax=Cytospora mali TaxID=578113 RepID=A0A194VJ46_CYTMA|nr:mRNA-capping enzyme subunit beta [Valsa mali]